MILFSHSDGTSFHTQMVLFSQTDDTLFTLRWYSFHTQLVPLFTHRWYSFHIQVVSTLFIHRWFTYRCVPEGVRRHRRLPVQPAPDPNVLWAPPGVEVFSLHLRGSAVWAGEPEGECAGVSGWAFLSAGGDGAEGSPQRCACRRSALFVCLLPLWGKKKPLTLMCICKCKAHTPIVCRSSSPDSTLFVPL